MPVTSDDVFHWRGLEFRPLDDSFDYWESGRWSVLRERGARSMVWRATWRYSPEKWESAFNSQRPWDRLSSLDALVLALIKRTERYAPDVLNLERQILALLQERNLLDSDIELVRRHDGSEEKQESQAEALQCSEAEGDRTPHPQRGWQDVPLGSGEHGGTPAPAHQDPQGGEGLID